MPKEELLDRSKLKDSKKFTSKKKINTIYQEILENCTYFGIDSADVDEIDKYNILQATQRSMHRSLTMLIQKLLKDYDESIFDKILIYVDGNYFNTFKYFHDNQFYILKPSACQGDSLSKEISGASILAKVSRDIYETSLKTIQTMRKIRSYQINMLQKFILKE